jgi:hypothetical protein
MDVADPPCDFDAFIAESRGISTHEARELIASWVATYVPRTKVPSNGASESLVRATQGALPSIARTRCHNASSLAVMTEGEHR